MQPVTAKPLYIRMHADDNVAIVANRGGLHPGAEFACGLRLVEQIPQGHKVALADIGEGEAIRRYGEVIGRAAAPIARGSWVKESLVQMPDAPSFDNLPTPNGGAIAAAAAGRLHVRGLSQCRRLGRHPQHPGDHDQRAMRRRRRSSSRVERIKRAAAEISQRRRRGGARARLWLRRRDRRAGRRRPDPHAAATSARNPNFGGEVMVVEPRLREAAARAAAAAEGMQRRRAQHRCACRTKASRRLRRDRRGHRADGRRAPAGYLNAAPPRDLPGVGAGGRHAVRRQRCVLRRDRQSGGGLLRRPAGARRRHRDVLRSHRGARRHRPADAARGDARTWRTR